MTFFLKDKILCNEWGSKEDAKAKKKKEKVIKGKEEFKKDYVCLI